MPNARFTINENGVLICPVCDGENTQINQVALVPNSFTSIPGIALTAQGEAADTTISLRQTDAKDSGQKHAVVLRGFCLNGWHQWDLVFSQISDQTISGTYQLNDMTSLNDQTPL